MSDIPSIPLEDFEPAELTAKSDLGVVNSYIGALDYGVIGAGQAGGRIAYSFYKGGYKKCVAINTATADLKPLEMPDKQKLLIGDGAGSGKDMARGKRAAEESAQLIFDTIKNTFGKVDKIIIASGFGGGTGAGSLPTLVEIAQKYLGMLGNADPEKDVIIIGALPTAGELRADKVKYNNDTVKDVMFNMADAGKIGPLILIDNAKIEALYRNIPTVKFWGTVNDTISILFQTFNFIATQTSNYTSFDVSDYKNLISVPGLAVMGVTKLDSKELTVAQALQDNFKKTLLYSNADYKTAKAAGCILSANDKAMADIPMDTFNYGFDTIANLVGNATVFRGLYDSKALGIRAFTFITGMHPVVSNKGSIY